MHICIEKRQGQLVQAGASAEAFCWPCAPDCVLLGCVDGPQGEPVQLMQDWLERMQLDRALLTKLASNHAAVEAWLAWQEHLAGGAADEDAGGSKARTMQGLGARA